MHRLRNQLTISAVALVLGFLVVVQLRVQQSSPGLSALSAQDLTVLVANLNTRNDQLRTEIARLERELASLTGAQSRGETSVDQIRQDLARLRAWSGLEPVVGPGVTITISGAIEGAGVEDLINELHNAGAEAIAVDDVRITARSVAVQGPRSLEVDGVDVGRRFSLRAVGSPDGLLGAMQRPGGIISQLKLFISATIQIRQVESVELPASELSLLPDVGKPIE